jgi:hypothetical protein
MPVIDRVEADGDTQGCRDGFPVFVFQQAEARAAEHRGLFATQSALCKMPVLAKSDRRSCQWDSIRITTICR